MIWIFSHSSNFNWLKRCPLPTWSMCHMWNFSNCLPDAKMAFDFQNHLSDVNLALKVPSGWESGHKIFLLDIIFLAGKIYDYFDYIDYVICAHSLNQISPQNPSLSHSVYTAYSHLYSLQNSIWVFVCLSTPPPIPSLTQCLYPPNSSVCPPI